MLLALLDATKRFFLAKRFFFHGSNRILMHSASSCVEKFVDFLEKFPRCNSKSKVFFLLIRFKSCFETARLQLRSRRGRGAKNQPFTKQKHYFCEKTLNFGPNVVYETPITENEKILTHSNWRLCRLLVNYCSFLWSLDDRTNVCPS